MADTDRSNHHASNQNANKSKAAGERWTSGQGANRKPDQSTPADNYPPDDADNAGGITNRPLEEEVDNQESLPPRGTSRESDVQSESNQSKR